MPRESSASAVMLEHAPGAPEHLLGILQRRGWSVNDVSVLAGTLAQADEAVDRGGGPLCALLLFGQPLPEAIAGELLADLQQLAPEGAGFIAVDRASGEFPPGDSGTSRHARAACRPIRPVESDCPPTSPEDTERLAVVGQTVTEIAHESRNLLQRIHSSVELLQRDLEASPQQTRKLAQIEHAAGDLARLLEEVRTYAAPIRLRLERLDLREIWRSAWSRVAESHTGGPVEFSEEIGDWPLVCPGDRFQLEQVFRNLFENALSACPPAARIRVRCTEAEQQPSGCVTVSVCDNGSGITEMQRQRAFQPFFTTKRKGTGLGLPIVKRILEAHGGTIAWGTDSSGAELILTLPRASSASR